MTLAEQIELEMLRWVQGRHKIEDAAEAIIKRVRDWDIHHHTVVEEP